MKKSKQSLCEKTSVNKLKFDSVNLYCGIGIHIILLLFTFGIWYCIWIYRIIQYFNHTPSREQYKPATKILLSMVIPFYAIYWMHKHRRLIDLFAKSPHSQWFDFAILCLLFVPAIVCILM